MNPRLAAIAGRPRPEGRIRPDLVFLDVESCGLGPASYPLEVGLSDDALDARSWIVRPAPGWIGWSPEAEAIHGIARCQAEGGIDVREAADRIDAALEGRAAVSDMPRHDAFWLDALYEAAGRRRPFPVVDVHEALFHDIAGAPRAEFDARLRDFDVACGAVERLFPHTHRAGEDAVCTAACWRASVDPAFLVAVLTAA